MNEKQVPLNERVQTSFQILAEKATHLNQVSDELTKPIETLDAELKQLGLGISAWIIIHHDRSEYTDCWYSEELGYTKLNNRWGIALRTSSGDYNDPENDTCHEWHFADSPRSLRIKAVDHLPALLDELSEEAVKMASAIRAKTEIADQVVAAVRPGSAKGRK